ncbi:MAG: DUF2132 domain-containing protein [Methylococcaceae bacterium]|nr:DUF2132 domain-containing protein [Methylococcaceae bacterium]
MHDKQPDNPLHGMTLEKIVIELVAGCGWEELGRVIDIRCFNHEPSVKSSLKFLRKTPWARAKVEEFYLSRIKKSQ